MFAFVQTAPTARLDVQRLILTDYRTQLGVVGPTAYMRQILRRKHGDWEIRNRIRY